MASAKPPSQSRAVNSSPLFDSPSGWSSGYTLAIGHGPGVVVGPGSSNPNVFAQGFQVKPGQQFKVVARASSVERPEATGAVQINWLGEKGKFISVSQEQFKVTPAERTYQTTMISPRGAVSGTLYVTPGGKKDAVRYTEMSVIRLKPIRDFTSYEFAGIKGQNVLISGAPCCCSCLFCMRATEDPCS